MALDTDKMERWRHLCRARGWAYPTPADRLAAKVFGRDVRPSLFWPSWLLGTGFGILAAVLMVFASFALGLRSLREVLTLASMIGTSAGVAFAVGHGGRRVKLGLPSWEDF